MSYGLGYGHEVWSAGNYYFWVRCPCFPSPFPSFLLPPPPSTKQHHHNYYHHHLSRPFSPHAPPPPPSTSNNTITPTTTAIPLAAPPRMHHAQSKLTLLGPHGIPILRDMLRRLPLWYVAALLPPNSQSLSNFSFRRLSLHRMFSYPSVRSPERKTNLLGRAKVLLIRRGLD